MASYFGNNVNRIVSQFIAELVQLLGIKTSNVSWGFYLG
jgi:hypothetical protein